MKKTKKALLTSVFALILSVAMLAGSTMAWFTDTASSTGNRIVAGNLDVDLLMYKGDKYESISGTTGDIFNEAANATNSNKTLWEPGKTQIVFLAVQNKSNLALKYSAVIDVVDNGLVGSLEYAWLGGIDYSTYVTNKANLTSWNQIKSYATSLGSAAGTGDIAKGRTTITTGVLDEIINGENNECDYVALAVHMKETAGNEYQGKDVVIDVNIVATQKDAEEDAFGSEYDQNSTLPAVPERLGGYGISGGIRKSSTAGQVTVTTSGATSVGDETEKVEIQVETHEDTSTSTTSQTIGGATVPAPAAIDVMDKVFADSTTFKEVIITEDQSKDTDDVLVLTMNVETIEAKPASIKLDISMDATAVRTVTVKEEGKTDVVTEQKKETSVTELIQPVTVELELATGLENVEVTHTHGTDAPVAMQSVGTLAGLVDGTFHYDKTTGVLTLMTKKFSEFEITYVAPEVCRIGTTPYSSLEDAVDAYQTGDVIVLTKDITAATIVKDVTVISNGQSLIATVAYGKTISISEGTFKTLTMIGDGTCNVTGGTFNALTGSSTGTLKLSGGTFYVDPNAFCLDGYEGIKGTDNLYRVSKTYYISATASGASTYNMKTKKGTEKYTNLPLYTILDGNHTEDGATYFIEKDATYVCDSTVYISRSIVLNGNGATIMKSGATDTQSNNTVLEVNGRERDYAVSVVINDLTLDANHTPTVKSSTNNKAGSPSLAFSVFNAYAECNNCTFKRGNSGGVQLAAHNAVTALNKTDTRTSAILNNCKFEENWDWRDGGTTGKLTDIKIEFKSTEFNNREVVLVLNNTPLVAKSDNNNPIVVEYNGQGVGSSTCTITNDGVAIYNDANMVKVTDEN